MQQSRPIGIFDSGYGGLTVFRAIKDRLPQYDYVYLGDNARAPYGDRSFQTVYEYTLQAVNYLFDIGCPLIILACNTASAKALRQIQKNYLPTIASENRVLGVIRPSAEEIGAYTQTKSVGIVGTRGTIRSDSYKLEIAKTYPEVQVFQQECPMWVPLIEHGEYDTPQADIQIKKNMDQLLSQSDIIDTILLGCTHYPLILDKIRAHTPENITILTQGPIVADKLDDYLQRHKDIANAITKNGNMTFLTTDDAERFNDNATIFFGEEVTAKQVRI